MKKKIYQNFLYAAAAILVIFSVVTVAQAATGYVAPTDKWAWGTNIGWINFNPTHGGVMVYDDHLEGYAWAENVGWIRLGTHEGGGAHTYANDAADTYGVNNDGTGNLSGYAWGTNIGWINFNPTHGGVTVDSDTGELDGYAWTENVGWINFNGETYQVSASSTVMVLDSGLLANGQTVGEGTALFGNIRQFTIEFTQDVYNPAGSNDPDDVTNPDNYLLFQAGEDGVFDTVSCDAVPGVDPKDEEIPVGSVDYSSSAGRYTATVSINDGNKLLPGEYRLMVCGSTSIVDLNGVELAGDGVTSGTDWIVTFSVTKADLPDTGFVQGFVTDLPVQPAELVYAQTDMALEIPSLNVMTLIAGIPLTADGWDVTWLGDSVGHLSGSAFPTWPGNTVLTGHVWDANNQPGIFAELKTLRYGDEIRIHAWGKTYTYRVRETQRVSASSVQTALQHEELDWITLVTCEDYQVFWQEYEARRVVRAVLVEVK